MSVPAVRDPSAVAIAERLIIANDLSKLSPQERIQWYRAKCAVYGLDWRVAPFDYLALRTGLKLYLNAIGADMLRKAQHISITSMKWEFVEHLCVATVEGETPDGRRDKEIGAVSIRGLQGEELANAPMKALTKAKRRLVISMGAIGADEEVDLGQAHTIPAAEMDGADPTEAQMEKVNAVPNARLIPPVRTDVRLTVEQQDGMYHAAVERNVGGIMPVDIEQEPSTQTWGQVVSVITQAWMNLNLEQDKQGIPVTAAPHQGVLSDGRVSPGRVYRSLLGLPIFTVEGAAE